MQSTFKIERNRTVIRRWLVFFMIALVVSGISAMPAETELAFAIKFFDEQSPMGKWLYPVYNAVSQTGKTFPYLFYGYDWLAFAHIVIAIAFIGPYNDPVKNKWVIEFGAISCILIIPFAFIAGQVRGIPILWTLIDCSFGLLGLIPLGICYNRIREIEQLSRESEQQFDKIFYHQTQNI